MAARTGNVVRFERQTTIPVEPFGIEATDHRSSARRYCVAVKSPIHSTLAVVCRLGKSV